MVGSVNGLIGKNRKLFALDRISVSTDCVVQDLQKPA